MAQSTDIYPHETRLLRNSANGLPDVMFEHIRNQPSDTNMDTEPGDILTRIRIAHWEQKTRIWVESPSRGNVESLVPSLRSLAKEVRFTAKPGSSECKLYLEDIEDIEKVLKTLLKIPLDAKLPAAFKVGVDEIKQGIGRR